MNHIKESRVASFIAVALVYAICSVCGIFIYLWLPFEPWLTLLIADVLATVICFIFSLIFNNASVYDPYWSVQPAVILTPFFITSELTPLRILLFAIVMIWAVRLTANWAYTFYGLNHQDWRYTMLKEKTGAFYPLINFVGIHMVPTLIVYACTLPAVYIFIYDASINSGSIVFSFISLLSVILQGMSDVLMHKHKKAKVGGFIHTGPWKHSRHPNYLGEIGMWWGVGLSVVCALPDMWYLALGALLNTILFLAVSIPMADGRQAKKDGFAEYKSSTRMLLPIPKFK